MLKAKTKTKIKVLIESIIMLLAFLVFNMNTVNATEVDEVIHFNDSKLKAELVAEYDINHDGELSKEEMKHIEGIFIYEDKGICDITGLEYATNLGSLYLDYNKIKDISSLKNLIKLKCISINYAEIEDITVLENLTNIDYLELAGNKITDITALENLTNIHHLVLSNNKINNISSLKKLINIEYLELACNEIINISALTNFSKVQNLCLNSNKIVDISPLEGLNNLETLYLGDNEIENISNLHSNIRALELCRNKIKYLNSLENLTNLEWLILDSNQIVDITPIKNLVKLNTLHLDYNKIIDISPLKDLTNLEILRLADNRITDVGALKNLNKLSILMLWDNYIEDFSPLSELNISELYINAQKKNLEYIDKETNIKLNAQINTIPIDTVLEIESITQGEEYSNIKTVLSDIKNIVLYNITLKSNDVTIQPKGKVKISIPIPSNFDKNKLIVYRITSNGEKTEYKVNVEGNFATFETSHFSTYILAEKKTEIVNPPYTEIIETIKPPIKPNISNITNITNAKVTGISDKTYTGKEIRQNVIVKDKNITLKEGTDYIIKYNNNVNVGTATITIKGKGSYIGTVTRIFNIISKNVTKTSVKLEYTKKEYIGKSLKPKVTIKDGSKTLKLNKDYTVSYKNNKKIGKATITIKGKGNYTGKVTKTFKIIPKKQKISVKTSSKKIKVNLKKDKTVTGYIIEYSTDKNFKKSKTKKITIKNYKTVSKTIKNLKKGKKYYVKVRSYKTIKNVKYYSPYSKVVKIKVK